MLCCVVFIDIITCQHFSIPGLSCVVGFDYFRLYSSISIESADASFDVRLFFFGGGLTLLELQSRFGDKPYEIRVVYPVNGAAVLKGLIQGTEYYYVNIKHIFIGTVLIKYAYQTFVLGSFDHSNRHT